MKGLSSDAMPLRVGLTGSGTLRASRSAGRKNKGNGRRNGDCAIGSQGLIGVLGPYRARSARGDSQAVHGCEHSPRPMPRGQGARKQDLGKGRIRHSSRHSFRLQDGEQEAVQGARRNGRDQSRPIRFLPFRKKNRIRLKDMRVQESLRPSLKGGSAVSRKPEIWMQEGERRCWTIGNGSACC